MINTSSQFADAVGRKRIAVALNVKETAVSNHVVRGLFPPSWFTILEALAAEVGVDCPRAIFSFKASSDPIPLNEISESKDNPTAVHPLGCAAITHTPADLSNGCT